MWRKWLFLFIAAFVSIADQLTKSWIRINLAPGESLPEIGILTIVHARNTGSAFGLFANQSFILTIVAILGLVIILFFYRQFSQSDILSNCALGLVFGGAIGNIIDRIRLGHVTDFIDVRLWDNFHWPAFNVADSAISIGVIILALYLIVGLKKKDERTIRI